MMNISQAGHTPQKSGTSDLPHVNSEITDSEVFLQQLNLAQQGTEWYMKTDVKSEKERVNSEQQAKRRKTEDLQDEQIVGMTQQAFIEQLKQSDVANSARVVSDGENQARTLKHVEKKHLHTPAVTEDGENGKADTGFKKIMTGELDAAKNGQLGKESVTSSPNLEKEVTKAASHSTLLKPGESGNPEMMQRFDASMIGGLNMSVSGKAGARNQDNGLSGLSKLTANETASGKTTGKQSVAKITSFSNINADTSLSNRKSEIGLKAESNASKGAEPVNIKDVVGTVKIMISSKTNEMVMKLAPEHLGKLEIKLKKDGDKLIGRFKVESRQAKKAIESQLPQLKEGLAEQGIDVEEFTVIINGEDGSSGAFAFNQGNEGETEQSHTNDALGRKSRLDTQTAENVVDVSSRNATGLNIYA